MSIYADLGLRPIINADATLTRLGGSIMHPDVVAAMAEAAQHFVDLDQLQRRVGERLARLTHNEAAFVTSGAAAGLALATAACVTGTDPAAIARLPDVTGLKDEVIVHRSQRNGYDHSVRMVGVKLVEIGDDHGTALSALEAAITAQTAAVVWFQGAMTGPGDIPLPDVIATADAHGIPVIIDGAAQLPPTENLWKWTQMGAALAVFSGGKDVRGPQPTGLILGRADLMEAVRLHSNPNHGLGRPMKVGKEEMVGLLKAVELYLEIDQDARAARDEATVRAWCDALNRVDGVCAVRAFPNEAGQPLPRARVDIDPAQVGLTRDQIIRRLREGEPAIAVAPAGSTGLFLNPMTLAAGEEVVVLQRLIEIMGRMP